MRRSRSVLGPVAAVALLLVVGVIGLHVLRQAPWRPVHRDPQTIPTAMENDVPQPWQPPVAAARRLVQSRMAARNTPGISVAVGVDSAMVWAEGFGVAELASRAPVTPETRFRIGTASEALTAAAAAALIEEGRLQLDADIRSYVPEFPPKAHRLTLQHLMAHTSGLGGDGGEEGSLLRQRCILAAHAVRHFGSAPLLSEPGAAWRRSSYGWVLASAAVEAAARRPWLDVVRERVLQPAGMTRTGAESAQEENPDRIGEPEEDPPMFTFVRDVVLAPLGVPGARTPLSADPATIYLPGAGPRLSMRHGLHPMRLGNLSCYAGAMALYSTPSDLVRFGLAMHSGRLLRAETVELLWTPQRLASGQETGYGLGWALETASLAGRTVRLARADGALLGHAVASLLIVRESGLAVAVAANSPNAGTAELAQEIAALFSQRLPE